MAKFYSSNGICHQITKCVNFLVHFTVFYLFLILLIFPLFFMILWRVLISFHLRWFYKGRYTILPAADALLCSNIILSTMNLNSVIFVNDVCDLNELRTRILLNISATDQQWNIPYKLLFHAIVTKYGFYCFEDKRKSFDINHHVRISPEVENAQHIYTESEMFLMIQTTAFQEWETSRPRWEMLLIPKVKKDETGETCSVIVINISHGYVDGISLANFIRNCVVDQPSPKLNVDPVNPPVPTINLLKRILLYVKVFLIGSHIFLNNSGCSEEQLMHEKGLLITHNSKFLGKTKIPLTLEKMKQIRKSFDCTTQAVFHSAFNGALKKITKRKQYQIPPEILGSFSVVRFPYPNEYLQNRALLLADLMPIGMVDPVDRLREINKKLRKTASADVALTFTLFGELVGLLPAAIIHATFCSVFKLAYYISNVPGIVGAATLFGKEIPLIFGVGPLPNGMRAGIGLSCFNGIFTAVFVVEKSELFKTRKDLDELIEEFENELKYYITASSV